MLQTIIGGFRFSLSHHDTVTDVPTRNQLPNYGKNMFCVPAYADSERMTGEAIEFMQSVLATAQQNDDVVFDCVRPFDLEQLARQFFSELGDDFSELEEGERFFVVATLNYQILDVRQALDSNAIAQLDRTANHAKSLTSDEQENYLDHITQTWNKPAAVQYVKDIVAAAA